MLIQQRLLRKVVTKMIRYLIASLILLLSPFPTLQAQFKKSYVVIINNDLPPYYDTPAIVSVPRTCSPNFGFFQSKIQQFICQKKPKTNFAVYLLEVGKGDKICLFVCDIVKPIGTIEITLNDKKNPYCSLVSCP